MCKKNMTLIVTVDCLIVFSYLISKIRTSTGLIVDGKGKFRKQTQIYFSNFPTFRLLLHDAKVFQIVNFCFVQKLINVNHLLMKNCDLFFTEYIFGKFLFKVVIIFFFFNIVYSISLNPVFILIKCMSLKNTSYG